MVAADFLAVGSYDADDSAEGRRPCCCFVPAFQEMLGEELCGRLGYTCAFLGK